MYKSLQIKSQEEIAEKEERLMQIAALSKWILERIVMCIKRILSILIALILVLLIPFTTACAADLIPVSLPDFSVTLNGQTTSSDYSQYPLLVYKDITYFPMTYYDCRLLGLSASWSSTGGLSIEKNDAAISEYVRDLRSSRNTRNQRAQIASGKIQVNGKIIDNSREQYPLLLFRDVTYFPLTWRFAADEFGWEYHFDQVNGLIISNSSVSFESNEEWSGVSEDFGGLMGTADLKLACMFRVDSDPENQTIAAGIRLYNITGQDIQLLPDDFCWEYRLYKTIGNKDELVYRKAVPFYCGEMLNRDYVMWEISGTGNKRFSAGDYRAELIHPEQYQYQIVGSDQIFSTPVSENGAYAVTFSNRFTVE